MPGEDWRPPERLGESKELEMFAAVFSTMSLNPPLSRPLCSPSSLPSNGISTKASLPNLPLGSRLFVSNLPFCIGEATLIKLFSKFGPIVEVKLAKHEKTKKSKGYAFIQYSSQDDALLAMEQMDQRRINGRIIYSEMAKPLNSGFADYPITSGPPSQPNSETSSWMDNWDGEEYY
ncbi:small RNA-binding protein 11, chloroplastic isoform X2 [Phoenix dactylifera]|uniref:Small RNA-binding protein 11, chloroplastic isoform X2 n=1 Tax=Phoenix dactylifera TaxID=42345 RepID=A0A8B7CYU1_PHODC|nr:small RNA-binding protein 11, chloroplastic isoform X2 [Phoenix dactylifera]